VWKEKNVSSAEPEARLCKRKTNPNNKRFADVPNDMYLMDGFEGQCVVMVPSKNVVIVRLGLSQKRDFDTNKFVNGVLRALGK
jgi:CubicO group peptidase (beta-lactamase class C family)